MGRDDWVWRQKINIINEIEKTIVSEDKNLSYRKHFPFVITNKKNSSDDNDKYILIGKGI